jgi:hypothetical protein
MQIAVHPVVDCPACGKLMQLTTVVPTFAGHPEIHSWRCDSCGEVRATEVEVGTLCERPIVLPESRPIASQ